MTERVKLEPRDLATGWLANSLPLTIPLSTYVKTIPTSHCGSVVE